MRVTEASRKRFPARLPPFVLRSATLLGYPRCPRSCLLHSVVFSQDPARLTILHGSGLPHLTPVAIGVTVVLVMFHIVLVVYNFVIRKADVYGWLMVVFCLPLIISPNNNEMCYTCILAKATQWNIMPSWIFTSPGGGPPLRPQQTIRMLLR